LAFSFSLNETSFSSSFMATISFAVLFLMMTSLTFNNVQTFVLWDWHLASNLGWFLTWLNNRLISILK
jgi:hypothetical protein